MSDNEYPDEYLDENGNEYQEEKPEQERGELKPCPFCGGTKICTEKGINLNYCDNCSAESNVEHWNTRPIEDALNARIAELEAAQRWIPVSERLPEEKQSVLALDRTGTAYHWEYSRSLSNIFVGYYTHWMPLPEPPLSAALGWI